MGTNVSRSDDISQNEFLQTFVGKNCVHVDDELFWENLLKFSLAVPATRYGMNDHINDLLTPPCPSSQEQLSLDSRLESSLQQFILNNLHSGNLGTLVEVFLKKANELLALSDQQNNIHIWQTFNALFIIRTVVKYLIETCSEEFQLLAHFEAKSVAVPGPQNESSTGTAPAESSCVVGSKFEAFVESLINLVVVIPVK